MRVEVLFFDGCPNHSATVALATQVVAECGVEAEILEIEVRDQAAAHRLRFLGSPSVRVDGVDIDPEAATRGDYGMACRMYGVSGVPLRELVAAALARGRS